MINTPRLTKHQIIDETVAYYSADVSRRAFNEKEEICKYYDIASGNCCAIGRCMIDPTRFKDVVTNIEGLLYTISDSIDDLLQEKYRGHEIEFWQDLQALHDENAYWCEEGLTEIGQKEVNDLKNKLSFTRLK